MLWIQKNADLFWVSLGIVLIVLFIYVLFFIRDKNMHWRFNNHTKLLQTHFFAMVKCVGKLKFIIWFLSKTFKYCL